MQKDKQGEVEMSDELTAMPAVLRGLIEGMHEAIRQKWTENATAFLTRAIINRAVVMECQIAGFDDAAEYFKHKTVWLISQALFCLSRTKQ